MQRVFFERLRELYPKDPWIAMQLSQVYQGLKLRDDACRILKSLLHLSPGLAAPWYELSRCANNEQEKTALLEKMLHVIPDHTPSMQELSASYLKSGRKESACKLLLRLTQIPLYPEQYEFGKRLYQENHCDGILNNSNPNGL